MKNKVLKSILLFILGSFIGYIFETLLTIYQGHYEVRKGLIYGGFIPVYGIGLVLYYFILSNNKFKTKSNIFNVLLVFLVTFVLGGITEYACSFIQEKVFGTISWDYSYLKYNFAGRTSLLHCTCWGVLGIIYYIVFRPLIEKIDIILNKKITIFITIILGIFIFIDICISIIASYRQYERRHNVEATTSIQKLLDKYYPDEYLDNIFINLRIKD